MRHIVLVIVGWWLTTTFVGAATHSVAITRDLDCEDSELCTLDILNRLEATYGCLFHAKLPSDTVCGAVQIAHGTPHQIIVYWYDADDPPSAAHQSRLKPSIVLPTRSGLIAELSSIPPGLSRMAGLKTARQLRQESAQAKATQLSVKLGLTPAEFKDLQEALH